MERLELEKLYTAIKNDDLAAFNSIMLSKSDLNISFGRFPILSLLYLYSSYKIIEKYEKFLFSIHNYNVVYEPVEAYSKFKKHAKKSLRFFVCCDKFVYPVVMLAVLDERFILQKYYKLLYKNEEIVNIIRKIYNLNQKTEINASQEEISLKSKKLTKKHKLWLAIAASVLAVMMMLSGAAVLFIQNRSGIGTAAAPIKISSEKELVTALKKGNKYYRLTNDIELTKNIEAQDFKGVLIGNGKTLIASGYLSDGLMDKLSGSVQDLTITASYDNLQIPQNFAILAKKSSGNIKNVKIIADINWITQNDTRIFLAGVVAENLGKIQDVSVDISGKITNNRHADVYYAPIAGSNEGEILGAKTGSAKIDADTVDIGGIVAVNQLSGKIENCENNTALVQVSSKEWHPNTAGVCITNYGNISGCKNFAEISAASTIAQLAEGVQEYAVVVGGIVCDNYGVIYNARNLGKVIAKSDISTCYVGGIAARNTLTESQTSKIERCKAVAEGDNAILVESQNGLLCVGGVVGYNSSDASLGLYCEVLNCGFVGDINATSQIKTDAFAAFVGGVVGYNAESKVENSYTQVRFLGIDTLETIGRNHLYGLVVGCLGFTTYITVYDISYAAGGLNYVTDNHYVVTGSKGGVAYGKNGMVDLVGKIYAQSPVEVKDEKIFVPHEKLESISSEVLIND